MVLLLPLLLPMAVLSPLMMTLLTSSTYILFVESFVGPNLSWPSTTSSLHHHHPSSLSSSSSLLKKTRLLFTTTMSASRRDNSNNDHDAEEAKNNDDDDDDFDVLLNQRLESMLRFHSIQELLRTRMEEGLIFLNRTIVRPSTVPNAGLGLFATVDSPKGTILTCYPGDALVIFSDNNAKDDDDDDDDDDDQTTTTTTTTTTLWGSHVPQQYQQQSYVNSEYMLRAVSDDWGIVALPILDGGEREQQQEQQNDDDTYDTATTSSYLGHYANDGTTEPPTCESDLSRYVLESNAKSNAIHQPIKDCHMVTVATKDIQKGQEIFVTYGPEYWMEQPSFGTSSTTTTSKLRHSTTTGSSTGKGFG